MLLASQYICMDLSVKCASQSFHTGHLIPISYIITCVHVQLAQPAIKGQKSFYCSSGMKYAIGEFLKTLGGQYDFPTPNTNQMVWECNQGNAHQTTIHVETRKQHKKHTRRKIYVVWSQNVTYIHGRTMQSFLYL